MACTIAVARRGQQRSLARSFRPDFDGGSGCWAPADWPDCRAERFILDRCEHLRAPNMLARWSVATKTFSWRMQFAQTAGDLVPLTGRVLALHDSPRLYDAATGDLIAAWPDLSTGHADSSIVWNHSLSGPARVAIDQANRRFAVTDSEQVMVVHVGLISLLRPARKRQTPPMPL